MGDAASKSCSASDDSNADGFARKPYTWYGFNVLSAECKAVDGPSGQAYTLKKFPNVFLYVSIGLAVLLLMVLITRIRAG